MIQTQTCPGEKTLCNVSTFLGLIGFLLLFIAAPMKSYSQTVPAATASSSSTLTAINGNAGHIAANSLGDVFYVSQGSNTAYWLPRGAATPIALITGLSGSRNIFVDSKNNVYVPNTYSGSIIEIPYVNGAYATGISPGVSACSSVSPTAPCTQTSAGSVLNYYYQPLDISMDAAGNLYVIDTYTNGGCSSPNCIIKFPRVTANGNTVYGAATVVKSGISSQNYNAQLTAAPNGDIYYAAGGVLSFIGSGTTNPVAVGTFTTASGATSDMSGNIFVTDSSKNEIYEFPAVNGVAQTNKQFAFVNTYSANGVAFDGLGDMFYTGYSGGTNLNIARLNGIPLGSSNVGTPAATAATSVNFTFSASTTPAAIAATGSGFAYAPGSCTAGVTYSAGSSCTVNIRYTPSAVGLQRGSVSLTTSTGASLSTALLSGIGVGPAETNDPGTVTAIGSGFSSPQGVRVDDAGNVFVADAGQNAVLRYANGGGAPAAIGSGLLKPSSVAIDGAGNVFIADAGNGRVVEVPNLNGTLTNSAQTVVAGGFGTTLSIALDRYGNLYIADGGKPNITKLGSIGGTPSASATSTVGSGFTMPFALAVDDTGNLFVADYAASAVSEITFYSQAQSTIGSGLSKPTGIVADASGSLYIADSGNSRLLKVPLEGTAFNTNDQYSVGSTVALPYSLGIDAAGNLYVTDLTKASVSEINRTAGTLALGRAQINTTTAPSNAYVGNAGNATLTLGTPDYTAVSATPSYFSVTAPSGNGCANGGTVAAGFACIISVTFSPATTGNFSDLLTFSSDAVNSTVKTLNITGRGLNLAATTTSLVQTSPAGSALFGAPVTIQATIASMTAGTPTGTVTFSVDGNAQSNPPAVANGVASITLTGLSGGSHAITATYSGDDNFAPSNGSLTITVIKASSTTSLSFSGVSTNPVSAVPGASVVLTATIAPSSTTAPTGNVTFSIGSTVLNPTPAPVTVNKTGQYQATITLTTLPAGTQTVTATYSGDVNYASSSGSAQIIISYPTFYVSPTAASITLSSGQTGSTNFTVNSVSGFAAGSTYVGFVCTGLPANSSCAFNPNNFLLTDGTSQPVTLQIITGQTPVVRQPITGAGTGVFGNWDRLSGALLLLGLAPLTLWGRRKAAGAIHKDALSLTAVLLLGFGISIFSGCGSGSGLIGVTPSGTYTVTVTATATSSISTGTYTGDRNAVAPNCSKPITSITANGTTTNYLTCAQTAVVSLTVK